jgi:short subunit dehydrogenase-like uncharacterized protein
MSQKYDIILFGCTGFTGKLAVEYLLQHKQHLISWAVSARDVARAQAVVEPLAKAAGQPIPAILPADLACTTPEQEELLRQVVQQTKVVLTCSGPFAKYGTTLVKLCAACGVHYADITGESDFVRSMVHEHDRTARETGAMIISHCGNDCIPQDLTVYELYKHAISKHCTLKQVLTYVEFPDEARLSGGTVATATYQLGINRKNKEGKPAFDPLVMNAEGGKSEFGLKNISLKSDVDLPEFQAKAGYVSLHAPSFVSQPEPTKNCCERSKQIPSPHTKKHNDAYFVFSPCPLPFVGHRPWIMGPVMVNCIRRSKYVNQQHAGPCHNTLYCIPFSLGD